MSIAQVHWLFRLIYVEVFLHSQACLAMEPSALASFETGKDG